MQTNLLNITLGFLEGFALIISPCILPILPIILSGSLTGSKKRPFGIIVGFVIIFALFTFFSRQLVRISGIDINLIRHISYVLLLLFGVVMLSTYLTEKFNYYTRGLANVGSQLTTTNNNEGGFMSGILFGSLIAIIWTPCAGPILAAVIVQTVIQETSLTSFLTLLAFGIGVAVPMLIIMLFGRQVMTKFNFFSQRTSLFRKILGVIIIASVFYMLYAESFAATSETTPSTNASGLAFKDGVLNPYPAPPIAGIMDWINSSPLDLNDLKGKVVLIDFWTYSCINCIRTLPYLKNWYQKYHDRGLVIIGIHAPEFEFEKEFNNVDDAVKKFAILYPVALDNDFRTWRNFQNRYWPAHYLIDKTGYVVYQHFGEGEYDVTENNIRYLLGIKGTVARHNETQTNFSFSQTPETYLGYERAENFASPERVHRNEAMVYTFPPVLANNAWALQGVWTVSADRIRSNQAGAALKIHFNARKVFMVMGNVTVKPIKVKVLLNGEQIVTSKGSAVKNSEIIVDRHSLYEVIALPKAEDGVLQVIPLEAGLEVYTFTFGS